MQQRIATGTLRARPLAMAVSAPQRLRCHAGAWTCPATRSAHSGRSARTGAAILSIAAGGPPAWAHAGAVGAARRLRCDARSGVAPRNSLRSLRSLRSNMARRVRSRSALRAPTPPLALQAAPGLAARPFARHEPSPGRLVSVLTFSPPQKSPPPETACRVATAEACDARMPAPVRRSLRCWGDTRLTGVCRRGVGAQRRPSR